jgi:quinol monooxygenase YgiN
VLTITARVTVDPERIDEYEALARELWLATHTLEPGCRRYEYVRLAEPGAYLIMMEFDDHDAFITHQASDHHTSIASAAMRPLMRSITLDYGIPVNGAFGATDGAAPASPEIDPNTRAYYNDRYPPPDFSGWNL